jgi:N-sulfoglucosamine sulfohydrolase
MSQTRPNILFAIADDASHYGCYGHNFVKTPHIDRAAREGILFTSAFTTNPKCAPSRASILTGKHTWQNRECSQHWNFWPDDLTVFPDLLEESGYFIGFTGKGWAPGDYKRCGRTRNPAGPLFEGRTLTPPEGSLISSKDYAGNFEDFLDKKPSDKPFYFWFGAQEPHRHYNYGEGMKHGKTLSEITEVPPYWPNEESIKIDMLDYAFEIEWFDKEVGRMLKTLEDRDELDNTLVIITSDNGAPFPRVKGQMYDDDFRLPFVALWKGKILPGRKVDDLISFTDIGPTFLEAGGCDIPPDMAGTSLFDIFNANGSGIINPDRNRAYMGRERHDMGREGDLGYPVRCIRTPQFLYCRNMEPDRWPSGNPETYYTNCDSSPTKERIIELKESGENEYYWQLAFGKRPLEELYDVQKDPYCLENLALKEAFAAVKNDLWKELKTVLTETGDPRLNGNPGYFDTIEYFVDAPHSWKHYLAGDWEKQGY